MVRTSNCLSILFCVLAAFSGLTHPALAQRFGGSIAVSNGEIFVGEADNDYRPGAVYVFTKSDGDWTEQAEITAPNGEMGDHFGESLTVQGDRMLIGAGGVEGAPGSAHVYERRDGAWTYVASLTSPEAGPDDRYGAQVALSGDFAFVGSPAGDEAPGNVYVFRRGEDGSWTSHSTLEGSAGTPGSIFGVRLAADDSTLFVGAPGQDDDSGAVYRFRYDAPTDAWTEVQVLGGQMVSSGDRFGAALELVDGELFIGAPQFASRIGGMIVFAPDAESGEWMATSLLLPYAATNPAGFGTAVAASGDIVWAGGPFGDGFTGSVYTYTRGEDGWTTASRLGAQDLSGRDMLGRSIDLDGDLGAVGIWGADYGAGAVAVFERDDEGMWVQTARLASESKGLEPMTGGQVLCENGAASLFDCERVDLLSFLPISSLGGARGVQLNDIWGWTDPETGREYALVGRVDGTAFVDVTDPNNPVYLGELPKTGGTRGSAWRDIKVYANHAFIVADNAGEHGMQVFDLTQLREVDGAPVTFEESARYSGINSAHNIVINTETGYAYTVGNSGGGETCGGGLHMINIQDPLNPTFAGCYAAEGTGRAGTGYTHDAQCLVYSGPDSDYSGRELCFGSNETALNIADVTEKDNPTSIATASYPNVSYTHQGWITDDHRYFYVNDELDELSGNTDQTRTLIWDVTDLDDPQLVKEYTFGNEASDHNLYVRDRYMYQSNYVSGLRIHDISDPENPVEVAFFDTMPIGADEAGFAGSWSNYPFFESGTIAVSSIGEGLFLLRKHPEQGL